MENCPVYFSYSTHKTREEAEAALERYFANGEISESERPQINRLKLGKIVRYCVVFPG